MSILKNVKNGLLTSDALNPIPTNAPEKSQARFTQYSVETQHYYDKYAKYADNVFDAQIQGLNYSNFYEWTNIRLRASNVINPSTGENLSTSFQKILILSKHVDFIPIGAYVKFNGATWIVFNPDNVAASVGTAIVIRCNTTYNTLDYYGNIVKTPMYYAKGSILASSPYYMQYSATIDGYQHVIMQLNDVTKGITNNTRLVLGKSAFAFYGVVDFAQEFTDDQDSIHLFRADLRLQETLDTDDIVNHIADQKNFSFVIHVGGKETMHEGDSQTLSVVAQRNGQIVSDSDQNPISYLFESSDESIATVDANGVVSANAVGSCTITCTLVQNMDVSDTIELQVEERESSTYVDFITPIPSAIRAFDNISIQAGYYEDGVQQDVEIDYSVSGAEEDAYTASVYNNILTIDTWFPTDSPLLITAKYGDYEITSQMSIEGY